MIPARIRLSTDPLDGSQSAVRNYDYSCLLLPETMMSNTQQVPDPFDAVMHDLADAEAVVSEIEALLSARSLSLRPPPPVPTTCCGRGCNGCVWQGYFEALQYWRDQARELLRPCASQ